MKYQSVSVFPAFIALFLAVNIFCQTPAPDAPPVLKDATSGTDASELFQVGEVRGAVNSKAVYLPKPVYPNEAREAGAEGKVTVQITIDEDGNVISANALSGHSLLKNVSEETARRTKFRIARDAAGQAVQTNGVLAYSFAIQKAGWTKIGYDLAILAKAPTLRNFPAASIAKTFQPEWTQESEMLGKIAEMKSAEIETPVAAPINNRPFIRRDIQKMSNGSGVASMRMEVQLPILNPPTPERIAISQNLISSLQSRLGNDALSLWQFNLGVNLSKALWLFRNPVERSNAAQILRQTAENAPPNVTPEVLAELQKLIAVFARKTRAMETEGEIGKSLSVIFRSK